MIRIRIFNNFDLKSDQVIIAFVYEIKGEEERKTNTISAVESQTMLRCVQSIPNFG